LTFTSLFQTVFPYGNPSTYKTIGEATLLDDFQKYFIYFSDVKKPGQKIAPALI